MYIHNTERIVKYILDTSHQIKLQLDSSFDDTDLNGLQARILGFIERSNLMSKNVYQKNIEAEFKIRRSSVSSVLNTMEKNGYIERQSDDSDARLKKIVLTDKAKLASCKHRKAIDAFEESAIKNFTEEEISALKELLGRVLGNVREIKND